MDNKNVVVIGGANIDIGGTPYNKLIPEDSNPGKISITYGGVGRNIAHNLSNLGVNVKLITAVGNDVLGRELLEYCEKTGIDTSHSLEVEDIRSSMYMYINDDQGDMNLALSDMEICSRITPDYIDQMADVINGASAVIADCNIPQETLMHIRDISKVPVFADPVSVSKSYKIKNNLEGFYAVKPNIIEAEYLADMSISTPEECAEAAEKIISMGVEKVFISMDERGILAADANNIYLTDNYESELVCTTGAGDSSTAAVVWAYLLNEKNNYLITASKAANAAAAMTIKVKDSINNEMTGEELLYTMNHFGVNIKILK